MSIHPTAVVEDGAELEEGVGVGPYAFIEAGARVGAGCVIGPHVVIYRATTLGPDGRVHAGAVLGDSPQDLSFKGGDSYVSIGAGCTIREGVTIHRGTKEGTRTEVGEGCFLMAFSHLAHNVRLGNNVILANGALLGGYVEIDDGAFLSGNVVVHQFCHIGRLAMLGGCCGISQDVPPFCMTQSVAFNQVVGLNVVGLRRAGMSAPDRSSIKTAFAHVYRSGLGVKEAVRRIRSEFDSGPAIEFADFIAASERGICHRATP